MVIHLLRVCLVEGGCIPTGKRETFTEVGKLFKPSQSYCMEPVKIYAYFYSLCSPKQPGRNPPHHSPHLHLIRHYPHLNTEINVVYLFYTYITLLLHWEEVGWVGAVVEQLEVAARLVPLFKIHPPLRVG